MKNLFIIAILFLLSACGGGVDVVADTPHRQATMHGSATKVQATTPGELRAYDLAWSQDRLIGTPKTSTLMAFTLSTPEVRLEDVSVSFDKDGLTGGIYRLYQAAFGRTPDVSGLGYWKQLLELNRTTIDQVAAEFLASEESRILFGSNSSDVQYVERLYLNVLKRKPDAAGEKFWLAKIQAGTTRAAVLLAFAASPENKAFTKTAMDRGMLFAEPGIAYIPVSNATGPAHVLTGAIVQVDGSMSTDANGDRLYYTWTIVNKPAGSNAALTDFSAVKPKLLLDKAGTYELSLRTSDGLSPSYSPAKVIMVANALVADSGKFTCSNLDAAAASTLFMAGHTYLDRDNDGLPCRASDLSYERSPPVPAIGDTGTYTCSSISRETAFLMYLRGHTYLDRDKDGKPCEANDVTLEKPVYTPPVVSPPVVSPPNTGRCYVSGYRKKNGTWVSGYYRKC